MTAFVIESLLLLLVAFLLGLWLGFALRAWLARGEAEEDRRIPEAGAAKLAPSDLSIGGDAPVLAEASDASGLSEAGGRPSVGGVPGEDGLATSHEVAAGLRAKVDADLPDAAGAPLPPVAAPSATRANDRPGQAGDGASGAPQDAAPVLRDVSRDLPAGVAPGVRAAAASSQGGAGQVDAAMSGSAGEGSPMAVAASLSQGAGAAAKDPAGHDSSAPSGNGEGLRGTDDIFSGVAAHEEPSGGDGEGPPIGAGGALTPGLLTPGPLTSSAVAQPSGRMPPTREASGGMAADGRRDVKAVSSASKAPEKGGSETASASAVGGGAGPSVKSSPEETGKVAPASGGQSAPLAEGAGEGGTQGAGPQKNAGASRPSDGHAASAPSGDGEAGPLAAGGASAFPASASRVDTASAGKTPAAGSKTSGGKADSPAGASPTLDLFSSPPAKTARDADPERRVGTPGGTATPPAAGGGSNRKGAGSQGGASKAKTPRGTPAISGGKAGNEIEPAKDVAGHPPASVAGGAGQGGDPPAQAQPAGGAPSTGAREPASREPGLPLLAGGDNDMRGESASGAPAPTSPGGRGFRAAAPEDHPGAKPRILDVPDDAQPDDLKLLKGIGPKNEQALHELGIFHFRQIAEWSEAEAEWVGSYLAFPGRIEREDWIGQAKALLAGTPPEQLRLPPGAYRRH